MPRPGFALLIVLLVLVLLSALVADLAVSSWLAQRSAQNVCRDVQAEAATDGLLRATAARLAAGDLTPETLALVLGIGAPALPFGDAVAGATVEDESGKFNVNLLASPVVEDAQAAQAALESLLRELGHEAGLVQGIADLVRARTPRLPDAATPPDAAPPGVFEGPDAAGPAPQAQESLMALEELLRVQGLTEDVLYGGKAETPPLAAYLTCWGTGQVNVNTAPPEVLRAVLGDAAGLADDILRRRQQGPIDSVASVAGAAGPPADEQSGVMARLTTSGNVYTIVVRASSGNLASITRAVVAINPQDRQSRFLVCRRTR
jgi:type II secretory pathway component PulK